tara:strand:- start:48 stop:596 length:549 start_codon:yes stop_codon:yes gene_type:complete
MAFKLNGNTLPLDVPFTNKDINYPANWLRLATAQERKDIGITEVDDPVSYDERFYNTDGSAKPLDDADFLDKDGKTVTGINGEKIILKGVKTILKNQEKYQAGQLLKKYDWYVVRKAEKSTAIPTEISTYRDAVRTACDTREKEIDACSDTAALVTLFGSTFDSDGNWVKDNITQYPKDPNA